MKAQAYEMENKIKTGNSSMFCNEENKKRIVIFSSAIKKRDHCYSIYLISVSATRAILHLHPLLLTGVRAVGLSQQSA